MNCESEEGIWILFDKSKHPITLKASEALEEALCFGWIDGLMKSMDESSYCKYFSQRRKNSKCSEKNKSLALKLENQGLMSIWGKKKYKK